MGFLDIFKRKKKADNRPLEWVLDDEPCRKKDYINSSEYIVPSDASMNRFLKEAESGAIVGHDIFFRIDGVEMKRQWARLRDYGFHDLMFYKKEGTFVLEGDGLFMKKNLYGEKEYLTTTECCIFASVTYENKTLRLKNCRGFSESDPWYAFVLLFTLTEGFDNAAPNVSLETDENKIAEIAALIARKETEIAEKKEAETTPENKK